jgi:protein-S-isoprenylcysteine O-methyltransferase Ste14
MRVNRFFSSVIRIQTDRGQHVVTTGPYAFVRHPGYTAGILIMAASGPALGSWLATALLVIFSVPFLLYRAHITNCGASHSKAAGHLGTDDSAFVAQLEVV